MHATANTGARALHARHVPHTRARARGHEAEGEARRHLLLARARADGATGTGRVPLDDLAQGKGGAVPDGPGGIEQVIAEHLRNAHCARRTAAHVAEGGGRKALVSHAVSGGEQGGIRYAMVCASSLPRSITRRWAAVTAASHLATRSI